VDSTADLGEPLILVTGATGNVGGQLIAQLCAAGHPARALVRNPEKADDLRGYDCEVAVGDYGDPPSLGEAMRGIESIFLLTPAGPNQVAQERAVIDAGVRAGATRVVKQAVLGFDAGIGRLGSSHAANLEHLRASGVPHTVLAPNSFMQNLLGSAATVQQQSMLALPGGEAAVSHVDARDVAAVAAHVLTTEGHEGATYEITGPEALTYAEVAAEISELLGREITYVDAPPAQAREAMVGAGMSAWLADALGEAMAAYRQGAGAKVTDEVEKATGHPARPLRDFLAHHRGAFA